MSYSETLQHVWSADSKRIFLSTYAFGKNTYFYAQEVGYFKTQYPYFVERNGLESFLILVTVKGKGFLEYEDKKYTLTENGVFFIDCTQPHRYYASKDNPWEFYWIHIYGNASKGYFYQFYIENKSPVARLDNTDAMVYAVKQVIALAEQPTPLSEALCSKYITDLLTEIIRATVSSAEQAIWPDWLRYILTETERRFTDKELTLKDLAQELHVDCSYLSKRFKKYFGVTFVRYLTMKRLTKSKELLRYTQLTMSEIADLCGFDNSSYFIKVFVKYESITPYKFRRKCQ
jgi:AraC-like DNA-binding protein